MTNPAGTKSRMPVYPWASNGSPPVTGTEAYKRHVALYTALGQWLGMWSRLEASVDIMARMFFDMLGGDKFVDSEDNSMPLGFAKQIAMIRKTANKSPSLAQWRSDIRLVCSAALRKNDDRKFLVHGRLTNHREFEINGIVTLSKPGEATPFKTSVNEIVGFFVSIRALAAEFNRITVDITQEQKRIARSCV